METSFNHPSFESRSLAMFERENRFVAMEYDDCDVTVTPGGETIDEHMRSIGFQGLKNVIGQATTIGRTGGTEVGEDDADTSAETTTNATETAEPETSLEPTSTPPEVQSPVLGQTECGSQHPVNFTLNIQPTFFVTTKCLTSNTCTILHQISAPLKLAKEHCMW